MDVSGSHVWESVFKGCYDLIVNLFIVSNFSLTIIFGAVCWPNNGYAFSCVYYLICTVVISSIDLILASLLGFAKRI